MRCKSMNGVNIIGTSVMKESIIGSEVPREWLKRRLDLLLVILDMLLFDSLISTAHERFHFFNHRQCHQAWAVLSLERWPSDWGVILRPTGWLEGRLWFSSIQGWLGGCRRFLWTYWLSVSGLSSWGGWALSIGSVQWGSFVVVWD